MVKKKSTSAPRKRSASRKVSHRRRSEVHTVHVLQDLALGYMVAKPTLMTKSDFNMTAYDRMKELNYNPFNSQGSVSAVDMAIGNVKTDAVPIVEAGIAAVVSRYLAGTSFGRKLNLRLSKKWKLNLF